MSFDVIALPSHFTSAYAHRVTESDISSVCQLETTSDTDLGQEGEGDISFEVNNPDISKGEKAELLQFLTQNRHAFAKDKSELRQSSIVTHVIDTQNSLPAAQRFYRTSPEKRAEIDRQIEENLSLGLIEPSTSEWHAPVVLVKKADNSWRLCCDYRKLNAITRPQSFPLPRLEDVWDVIGEQEATIFSTLDLSNGFNQLQMDPDSVHKTTFVTQNGQYQWHVHQYQYHGQYQWQYQWRGVAEDVHARTRREAELREEIQTLSEVGNSGVSAGATARTVVITHERKLPKFSGRPATDSDPEVGEWTREIRQHVAELPESQKIDTIVGNLTGDARDEVQLLEEGEKDTAEKILQFLWRTYRPIETLAELTLKLATRKQRPDETVQSYSLALMKLHQRIKKRDKGTLSEDSVKSTFVESMRDFALRRELRKLAKVNATMTFAQFRSLALEEFPEQCISAESSSSKEVLEGE